MKRVSNLPWLAKLLLVLLTATTGTARQCAFCNSRWRKVYETNDKGRRVFGKFRYLQNTVKRAEPVRFLIPSLGQEGYVANSDQANLNREIYFLSMSYVSKASWKTFEEEPYHRLLSLNSKGKIMEARYNVNNFTEISHKEYKAGIKLFAKKSPCVWMVLKHAKNGKVTKGSVGKVISSIESGHDITKVWKNSISHPCRNVQVTDNGVVVGQYLWHITGSPLWSSMDVYTSGLAETYAFKPGKKYVARGKMSLSGRWFADSCWKHVFTNNEKGDGVDGSLSDLICSVVRGHRVKVMMGNISIEADNVRIKSGQISAQLLNRVYHKKEEGKYRGFWYWQMAHTTGIVASLKYWLLDGTSFGEEREKKPIRWFVDSKPWKTVLTTNKNGDVVFGSKSELRTAVENGAEVRVALLIDHSKPASNTPRKREVVCWGNDGQGGCLWDRHDRPCRGHGKPGAGNGKPGGGQGNPDGGHGKPGAEHGKPGGGHGKPGGGNGGQGGGHGGSDDCTTQEWTVFKTSNLELGPSGEVSAELLQSVTTEEVGSQEFKINKDASWKYMIVTTQGDVDVSQRGIGVNRNDGHFSVKYPIKWFVNY